MQYEIRAYDALYDTIAGVMLHSADAKEECYEPVD